MQHTDKQAAHTLQNLPAQAISAEVLLEKYAKGDERSIDAVNQRVARALAQAEPAAQRAHWEQRFAEALRGGFVPAGRIQSAAGTDLSATLINCFVQPVGDSIAQADDGHPGIYTALTEAAETMRRGGGVGYDFSRIRPRGAWVGSTRSSASGPGQLHARVRPLLRDGRVGRRAARRADGRAALRPPGHRGVHPRQGRRRPEATSTSRSASPTPSCRRCRPTPRSNWCTAPNRARRRRRPAPISTCSRAATACGSTASCRARELWDQIMRSTYDHAEPGVLFLDHINRDNNLSYCESIAATNPCAEQPLPPYGCCCLGSIDLTRFVQRPVRGRRPLRRCRLRRGGAGRRAHARQRARRDRLAAAAAAGRGAQQAPRRPGLHRPGRCAGDAEPALRQRRGARDGAAHRRADARRGLRGLGRAGARARRLPAVQRRPVPERQHLRLAPAAGAARAHPHARPAQLAPAVDRAHRHHQPGLRRQREQRHRAGLQLELHAQEAHARRQLQGVRGRGPRLAPVPAPEGRRRCAARRPS